MTAKKRPLASSNSARGNDRNTNNQEGETTKKDITSVTVAPAAAKNRVTKRTLITEVLTLWLAGDPDILRECDEFYKAWKLTREALATAARMEAH